MTTSIIIDDLGSIRQLRRTVDTKDTDGYILSQLRYLSGMKELRTFFRPGAKRVWAAGQPPAMPGRTGATVGCCV